MADDSGLVEFKQGIALLQKGHSAEAVEYLQHAVELKQQNPYYLSFLGVSMARALQKWAAAAELCRKAISMRRNEPQLYLNLAEVYMSAARRRDAVETLDAASRYCGADARIKRMRGRFGERCSPVLPFLERSNPLNRSLGRLRQRLLERLGKHTRHQMQQTGLKAEQRNQGMK
jgi:tetratricopeptide (TPR) repeat protein